MDERLGGLFETRAAKVVTYSCPNGRINNRVPRIIVKAYFALTSKIGCFMVIFLILLAALLPSGRSRQPSNLALDSEASPHA